MNPFRYGQVVGSDDFCPRPDLVKQLIGFIESGQNVVLQGERRMGKTSLIHEALRRLKRFRAVYTDLLEVKTADDLARRMIKAVASAEGRAGTLEKLGRALAHLRPSFGVDPMTGQLSVSLDPRIELRAESIETILDLVAGMQKSRPVAVVFDEFQDVLNIPDSKRTLALLRSKIQFHGEVAYIFAGSVRNRMSDIFDNPESPFFKSAAKLDVGRLGQGEFAEFLAKRFAKGRRSVTDETLHEIMSMADFVPGDTQQLCGALWDVSSPGDELTSKRFAEALELIFSRESKGYEAVLVQVTGQQMKCLRGLARLGGASPLSAAFLEGAGITLPASVKKALNRLVQLKVIYRHQGEYKFVNPFFKQWLLWNNY